MFFVFPFLLLSIYFAGTNNFVLKKDSQGPNLKQNDKDQIFQDVHDSTDFPTRKSVLYVTQNLSKTESKKPRLNQFSKKPDIPIKRHIQEYYEEDISSMVKSTKSSIATSARELKRKWPVVELLTRSDDFKEYSQYFDEFERKEISLIHDIEIESKVTELAPKYINRYVELHSNHSKVKPVGLRSLHQQNIPGINCEDGDQCVCRIPSKTGTSKPVTTTKTTTPRPPSAQDIDMGFPMGIPMGVPVGVPMGYPAGFPGFPAGYPAPYPPAFPPAIQPAFPPAIPAGPVPYPPDFPSNYQPNVCKEVSKHKKPGKTHATKNNYLYYDDDDEPENVYFYDEDSIGKKIKHKKQHKSDIIVHVEYDIEGSRDQKLNRNPKCRNTKADLATHIFNDEKKFYTDTVIKDCYCCSASSCGVNFRTVLLLICFFFCIK